MSRYSYGSTAVIWRVAHLVVIVCRMKWNRLQTSMVVFIITFAAMIASGIGHCKAFVGLILISDFDRF